MRDFRFVTPSTARREMAGKRLVFGDTEQIKLLAIMEDAKTLVDADTEYTPRQIDEMEWHEIKDLLP